MATDTFGQDRPPTLPRGDRELGTNAWLAAPTLSGRPGYVNTRHGKPARAAYAATATRCGSLLRWAAERRHAAAPFATA